MTEDNTKHVYVAINMVHTDLAKVGIKKNDMNKFDKYKFRGIDDIYNTVSPILAKHGLLILQRVINCETTERSASSGKLMIISKVEVEFDLVSAEDGSCHTIKTFGEGMDRGDKSINKALTAAYKYAIIQCFCIPIEGTPDNDYYSEEFDPEIPKHVSSIADFIYNDFTEEEKLKGISDIWSGLNDEEKAEAWKAKTKGGFFTIQEKELIRKASKYSKEDK